MIFFDFDDWLRDDIWNGVSHLNSVANPLNIPVPGYEKDQLAVEIETRPHKTTLYITGTKGEKTLSKRFVYAKRIDQDRFSITYEPGLLVVNVIPEMKALDNPAKQRLKIT